MNYISVYLLLKQRISIYMDSFENERHYLLLEKAFVSICKITQLSSIIGYFSKTY